MGERPILFSAPMVRAILAGTKTQTRRIVTSRHWSPRAMDTCEVINDAEHGTQAFFGATGSVVGCPYGAPGDLHRKDASHG